MRKTLMGIVLFYASAVQADQIVVAALGDSLTQGFGLPAEQGFVPQLQGWLDDEGADVRLDSLGWARYGFGSDWSVRAKLREISALNPLNRTRGRL